MVLQLPLLFSLLILCVSLLPAQPNRFFPPRENRDGIRYPLVLSQLVWDIEGHVTAVTGSDGLVHLAYALRMTNYYGGPIQIQSIAIVAPFAGYKQVGTNRVVAVDNYDYLIAEKLMRFADEADRRPEFARELPLAIREDVGPSLIFRLPASARIFATQP